MADVLSLSGLEPELDHLALWYRDSEAALREYYSRRDRPRFATASIKEIHQALEAQLVELELLASFAVLSAIEAMLRVDFYLRVQSADTDALASSMRSLYNNQGLRCALEEGILDLWKNYGRVDSAFIGRLKAAFKFRHWVAHGRYWQPKKLGGQYDFFSVYDLAQVVSQWPLKQSFKQSVYAWPLRKDFLSRVRSVLESVFESE